MVNQEIRKVVILGSGNVASYMAQILDRQSSVRISQIYSPNIEHAQKLAGSLHHAEAISDLNRLDLTAHYYIVAVKDDAIAAIAANAPLTGSHSVWAHTSGSVPADVFSADRPNYGVFYPLQTFNGMTAPGNDEVPMLIEGNNDYANAELTRLAHCVSKNVRYADSDRRKLFHLAAVFACNFTNRMWAIADDILRTEGYDLSLLEPLMKKTLENALIAPPSQLQTGPARRHDNRIIENHLARLPQDYADIYRTISDNIKNAYPDEQN